MGMGLCVALFLQASYSIVANRAGMRLCVARLECVLGMGLYVACWEYVLVY